MLIRKPYEEESSCEDIQQQLTVKDICLRQQIVKNTSKTHQYPSLSIKQSHVCEPSLSGSRQVNDNLLEITQRKSSKSMYDHSLTASSSICKSAKISSVAYCCKQNSVRVDKFRQKKHKLSVSLSLQPNSVKRESKSHLEQSEKESSCKRQQIIDRDESSRLVKIMQPRFHVGHPIWSGKRYNGDCLSSMIMRRAGEGKQGLKH